ncbi:MAG: LamG-like jellyroll fold domain-containing protein, partial [Terriglobia bacterium]
MFCNYDVTLQFEPTAVTVTDPNNPNNQIPGYAYHVELFDPLENQPKFLSDGLDGDTLDGVYSDVFSNWIKDFRCYDANGVFVQSPTQAATAVLTNFPGYQYTFEVINLDQPSPTDAAAWWKFDEGSGTVASDASGDGNTGTLVNAPLWTVGESGDALQFDGTSSYVNFSNPADLNVSGNITLAAWIYVTAPGQNQFLNGVILCHGQGSFTNPGTPGLYLMLKNNSVFAGVTQETRGGPQSSYTESGLGADDYGYWVHWAATCDGAYWKLYRNGALVDTVASTQTAVTVNDNWYVGCFPTSNYL